MKKTKILLAITLALVVSNGFMVQTVVLSKTKLNQQEAEVKKAKDSYPKIYHYLDAITVRSFKKKVENSEDFYIYFGRPTCDDCNHFEPDLIELVEKYQLEDTLLYLNASELRKDEVKWMSFKKDYQLLYTPTLAKFEKGKLVSKVEWTPENGISVKDVENWIVEQTKEQGGQK